MTRISCVMPLEADKNDKLRTNTLTSSKYYTNILKYIYFHQEAQESVKFIYGSFHIHYIISLLSRENMNSQLTSLPMCGFIAQLVEHRTGIVEVTGSNPVEAQIFFQASLFQLLQLEIHCEDHISPSYISAVHIWIISYTLHQSVKY